MKVVILAGGLGTRISEESHLKPKPMIEIGERPILWHIMKEYSHYGFHEFIICGGYKQHMIKEWFSNYLIYKNDVTFDFANNEKVIVKNNQSEPWKVTVVDTGLHTMTGGRIKQVQKYIGDETFLMTYGDGVSDVNMNELIQTHYQKGAIVTLTAAKLQQRFGILTMNDSDMITSFREKSDSDYERVNAGYMVMEPAVFDYIGEEDVFFEQKPLESLARDGKLAAYKFDGFWHPMDTMRDKEKLEDLWSGGNAPWNTWDRV